MNANPSAQTGARRTASPGARASLVGLLPVTERRLTLNGVSTVVLESGDGPPVVLLHGPGAYGAQFIDVIPRLATDYRVIAPDLPGHGESAFFPGGAQVEAVDGWLDDLIECTCRRPPALVGHTLGGAIAARYVAGHGPRVSMLVLVDALGLAPFQPAPEFGAALHAFLAAPGERTHDALWGQCVQDYDELRRRIGARWTLVREYNLEVVRRPGAVAALGSWMEHIGTPEIPETVLRGITIPTALVWGRGDRATDVAVAERAAARFGWALHLIDAAADDPTIEQPEAFVATLRAILRRDAR